MLTLGSLRRMTRYTSASLLLISSLLAGCGSPKAEYPAVEQNPALANLSGYVRDETGRAVIGAKVANTSGSQSAITDTAGHYSFSVTAATLTDGALSASAPMYSVTARRVPPGASSQDFVLRSFDVVKTVELPTGNGNSVTTVAKRGEGSVGLTIPADSLVRADGTPAQGQAEVRLTYWNPAMDMGQFPATLASYFPGDGNGPLILALDSIGMVDVQVLQNDTLLQVAPGKNLILEHDLPDPYKTAMANRPADMPIPYLFYYDPNISLWAIDGNIRYDQAKGSLVAELPHLTIWNFDNYANWMPPASCTNADLISANPRTECRKPENSSVGGCLTGIAQKKDGTPYANSTVRMYLLDNENVSAIDLPTDGLGSYCVNIGTRLCVPLGNNQVGCDRSGSVTNTVGYFISGVDSPDDSSMPNPIPNQCRAGAGASYRYISHVSGCGLIDDLQKGAKAPVQPLAPVAISTVTQGTSCNNGCSVLPKVTISKDGPKTPVGGTTPQSDGCKTYVKPGQACVPRADVCCLGGTKCLDYVCVPEFDAQK